MDRATRPRSIVGTGRGRLAPCFKLSILAGALALAAVGAVVGTSSARALAQDAPTEAERGITTIGYGEASAPAETGTLQIVITQEEFGPSRPLRPGATPGAEEREAVAPAVDALRAAGVAEEDVEVVVGPLIGDFYGPFGPGVARLDVALDRPTAERVEELINAATLGAAEEGLFLGQVGVGYEVADCRSLEREARQAAIADARERAELQADLLGVALGEPVASSDMPAVPAAAFAAYFGPIAVGEGGCAPPIATPVTGAPISVPPFDPTGEAEVEVYAQISVTFAIGDAGAS